METNILQDTQRILDLIAKRDLSDDGKIVYTQINEKVFSFL
jgi:hypothetical protein